MLDTDIILMKRAIELARKGAGLVSPNPLVGAVLVNEGRVVGEGFHRYDLLKHAETYAIEAAGRLSHGAALYCNLEPCSHHGRTPPCTDALIEAGISRAVISIKDPDRRVNGAGIAQLRDAGIDVEVGLLQEQSERLNESYLKFITTGRPFVHAVSQYPEDGDIALIDWGPSSAFLQSVCAYDAIAIGDAGGLNETILKEALSRERHRDAIIVTDDLRSEFLEGLKKRIRSRISIVRLDGDLSAGGKVVRLEDSMANAPRTPMETMLSTLGRSQVTSLLALPGVIQIQDASTFAEIDKLTLVLSGAMVDRALPHRWVLGNLEFDLDEVVVAEAGRLVELTGYPSLLGVA